MRGRLVPPLLAVAAAVLMSAGCSGSSKPATPTQSSVSVTTSQGAGASSTCVIPQNNGGDHDADNNGGPNDGDGCDK